MNEESSPPPTRALITSRVAWLDALRSAIASASRAGSRSIAMSDVTFADWPLSDPVLIDHLTRWALPHRKFFMVAANYDDVARRHPRFTEWRRTYSHLVECRSPEAGAAPDVPTLLVAEGVVVVRLAEPTEYRGIVSTERADLVQAKEAIDVVLQRSASAFPPTTLGL